MGLSPDHASTVPLVLNLDTGAITHQFHVVFDDWFTTATTSVDVLLDFNSTAWSKMFGDSEYQFIRVEDGAQVDPKDFMTSEAITTRQNRVSKAMDTTMPPIPLPISPPPSSPSTPSCTCFPVPYSPCLPDLLPLLCLPHQLVHHLQFSRGKTRLGSAPATEGALKPSSHPFTPATPTEGAIIINSSKIPKDMQSMIDVEHGPSKKSYASIVDLDLTEDTSLPLNPQLHHHLLTELGITDIQACKASLSDRDTLTCDQVLLDPDIEEWKKSTQKANHTAGKQRHMG